MPNLQSLPAFDPESGSVFCVIEAPANARNKFKYDETRELFIHHSTVPVGLSYPVDFGFVPSTHAEDRDPIDVHVVMDEPAFVGAVVPARLIGVIEAQQRQPSHEIVRNDRLIAVATASRDYAEVQELQDVQRLIDRIETFWISYNEHRKKEFSLLGRGDAARAQRLLKDAMSSMK